MFVFIIVCAHTFLFPLLTCTFVTCSFKYQSINQVGWGWVTSPTRIFKKVK